MGFLNKQQYLKQSAGIDITPFLGSGEGFLWSPYLLNPNYTGACMRVFDGVDIIEIDYVNGYVDTQAIIDAYDGVTSVQYVNFYNQHPSPFITEITNTSGRGTVYDGVNLSNLTGKDILSADLSGADDYEETLSTAIAQQNLTYSYIQEFTLESSFADVMVIFDGSDPNRTQRLAWGERGNGDFTAFYQTRYDSSYNQNTIPSNGIDVWSAGEIALLNAQELGTSRNFYKNNSLVKNNTTPISFNANTVIDTFKLGKESKTALLYFELSTDYDRAGFNNLINEIYSVY